MAEEIRLSIPVDAGASFSTLQPRRRVANVSSSWSQRLLNWLTRRPPAVQFAEAEAEDQLRRGLLSIDDELQRRSRTSLLSLFSFQSTWLLVMIAVASTVEILLRRMLAFTMINYRYWYILVQNVAVASFCGMLLLSRGKHAPFFRAPHLHILLLALLDAVQAILLIIPIGRVSFPIAILVPQMCIPLSLFVRGICTDPEQETRTSLMSRSQRVGAFTAFLGTFCLVLSSVNEDQRSLPVGVSSGSQMAMNALALFSSALPAVLSISGRSALLEGMQVDEVAFNFFSNLFQLLASLLMAPAAFDLQYMAASSAAVQSDDLPSYVVGGFVCTFKGTDSFAGDDCSEYFPRNLILALVYVLSSTCVACCMTLYIHSCHSVYQSAHQSTFIADSNSCPQPTDPSDRATQAIIISAALAFVVSYVPGIRAAAGENVSNHSFQVTAWGVVGIAGLIVAGQAGPPLPPDENLEDLWEAMEQDEIVQ